MWERACSRKRSVSHRICRLNHRLREQARSHICFVLPERSVQHTCVQPLHNTTVGAGLPAMAVGQQVGCKQAHRYRRQASSHR
ncbi:hypothetical protein DA482_00365 [Pseudomonas fluorescens]|nr:hypothetical protein D0N73_14390 [Pseudomonas fluorescens]TWR43637.1 hypothetical protein FIP59_27915 [Pseudomonas fluorescens]